ASGQVRAVGGRARRGVVVSSGGRLQPRRTGPDSVWWRPTASSTILRSMATGRGDDSTGGLGPSRLRAGPVEESAPTDGARHGPGSVPTPAPHPGRRRGRLGPYRRYPDDPARTASDRGGVASPRCGRVGSSAGRPPGSTDRLAHLETMSPRHAPP